MKNLLKISLVAIGLITIFSSCKKDPVNLENSYMDFITSKTGLWRAENTIRYVANLAPETLSGGETTIKFSSEADPEGFTIESAYWTTQLTFGRDVYNVQQIDRSFRAAAFTDAENGFLKVNPAGDEITINIGDGAFVETIDFEKKYDPLVVVTGQIYGSGVHYVDIDYYNESGDRPEIKVYSQSSSSPVTITPNNDLGDNGYYSSDKETKEAFGRTKYDVTLVYDADKATGADNEVLVELTDIIYVEINGKKYSVGYDKEERFYNTLMSPAN